MLQVQKTLKPHQFPFLPNLMLLIIGRVANRESVVQLLICRKSKLATVKLSSNSDEAATYSTTKCINDMGGLIFDWSSPFSHGTPFWDVARMEGSLAIIIQMIVFQPEYDHSINLKGLGGFIQFMRYCVITGPRLQQMARNNLWKLPSLRRYNMADVYLLPNLIVPPICVQLCLSLHHLAIFSSKLCLL